MSEEGLEGVIKFRFLGFIVSAHEGMGKKLFISCMGKGKYEGR